MLEYFLIYLSLLVLSLFAYREQSLTFSGALTASLVGIFIYLGFGFKGLFLLGIFFITSSYWSKFKRSAKQLLEEKLEKGTTRDYRQVIANGGAASIFSLLYFFQQDVFWLVGFAVCLASANSDTWSSEIGSLSKKEPISLRTFKTVERGTSGAISGLGSIAGLAGAFVIAILCVFLFQLPLVIGVIILISGMIGNILDTIIGAFFQQLFVCKICDMETEKKFHCSMETKRIKGISYVDNDMVNLLSGILASFIALGFMLLAQQVL